METDVMTLLNLEKDAKKKIAHEDNLKVEKIKSLVDEIKKFTEDHENSQKAWFEAEKKRVSLMDELIC